MGSKRYKSGELQIGMRVLYLDIWGDWNKGIIEKVCNEPRNPYTMYCCKVEEMVCWSRDEDIKIINPKGGK